MGEIVELYDSDFSKLVKGLEATSSNELCKAWEACVIRKPSNAARHLTALFKGLASTRSDRSSARFDVFVCAVKQLQQSDMPTKLTAEILGILMMETTLLPVNYLLQVLSMLIDSISSGNYAPGKWLELLPHFMSTICTRDEVDHDGCKITGRQYQSHVIDELCNTQWQPSFVASLAATFKEMSLSQSEMKLLFEKLLQLLGEMAYDNIPPLVYQLLQLSAKGHRQTILQGLVKFFNDEDQKSQAADNSSSKVAETESLFDESECRREELTRCQGTVLLHVMFAVRNDSHLGNEIVKFFKLFRLLPKKILTPFSLSLALCIATDRQFQLQIFDALKAAMLNSYKEKTIRQSSAWFREVFECGVDPDEVITGTIKTRANDWDHVLHGLIEFGSTLLDVFGSNKPVVGKYGKDIALFGRPMCKLGSSILFTIFKENRAMRATIVGQILNHILPTESASTSDYLELFSKTVLVAPQVYLDGDGRMVREVFDSFAGLPEVVATTFLAAVQPLLKASPTLRDAVLLFLRKAIFFREVNTRKIVVAGLLLCLANFKSTGTFSASQGILSQSSAGSSQVSAHVHVQTNTRTTNEAFCLEVLGILRRALTQQADVRVTLYMGLSKVVAESPHLIDAVLEMLQYQANLYIEPGAMPPLRLQRCVQSHSGSEVCLLEPLPPLIFTIQRCLFAAYSHRRNETQQTLSEDEEPWTHSLGVLLDDLVKALVKAELEDFELDKSADYSRVTSEGQKNYLLATQVMGVYETLIEYSYLNTSDYGSDMADHVLALFDVHQKLAAVIKEKSAAAAGGTKKTPLPPTAAADVSDDAATADTTTAKRSKTKAKNKEASDKTLKAKKQNRNVASTKSMKSILSDAFVVTALKDLLMDQVPEHQEALSLLRQKEGFEAHLINVAIQKITSSTTSSNNDDDTFSMLCSFARLLLHRYTESTASQLNLKVVGGFGTIVSIICSRFEHKLEIFLGRLVKERHKRSQRSGVGDRLLANLETTVKHLQNLVDDALNRRTGDAPSITYKESVCLLQALSLLVGKMPFDSQPFTDSLSWIENVLKREPIEDNAVIKSMLLFLLPMKRQQTSNLMNTLKELAHDVHMLLADIDESVELVGRKHFRMMSVSVVPTVIIVIIDELLTCQADVHWTLDVVKARLAIGDGTDISLNERRSKDNSVCRCLMSMSTVLLELIQSAFPLGPCVEALLRISTKYYATLTEVVKYFTSVHSVKTGSLCQRLEKLVKFVNSEVTRKVYPFITYIQGLSSDKPENKTKGKGAKVSTEVAKAIKEAKLIPLLIYNLEQYERVLIQLAQKSKVNLTSKMKMNINRDFRIALKSKPNDYEGAEDQEEKEDDQDNERPTTSGTARRAHSPPVDERDDQDEEMASKPRKRKKSGDSTPKKGKMTKEANKRMRLTPKSSVF